LRASQIKKDIAGELNAISLDASDDCSMQLKGDVTGVLQLTEITLKKNKTTLFLFHVCLF
jgi:hypothetical protein